VSVRTKPILKRQIDDIGALVYTDAVPVSDIGIWETEKHVAAAEAAKQRFRPSKRGREWGGPWATAWFRFRFAIPKALDGKTVVARIDTGGEAVAFLDGVPFIGLNRRRDELPLPGRIRAGRRFEVLVEAGANDDFGRLTQLPRLTRAELVVLHEPVRQLWYDLLFGYEALDHLDPAGPRAAELLDGLAHAANEFRFDAPDLDREAARVRRRVRPLFRRPAHASATEFTLSGHAHIDVAWKWPLAETTRKCARTFSSVVRYMDRFPDFRFTQTQAYLYEVTRAAYPTLYRAIREAVEAGRWEVATAMYVEADQNIPSGESLVRQLLFGTRFAREEFGTDIDTLVLPDVFGYNAQLPQLLRKAGIRYFTTQKISWNDTNLFPFNSFVWEGLDGSDVLAHFLPSHNYNAHVGPGDLIRSEARHTEKGRSKPVLYQYGYGDGGGGPTPRMIEFGRRARDFEGLPRCRFGFIRDFFHRLAEDADRLPRWVGEFYLELHRGTYTTQGRTKRLNRRAELVLREAELWSAADLALGGTCRQADLAEAWQRVLLNQFHDVLPGSSIREVYEVSEVQQAEAVDTAAEAAEAAIASLAARVDTRGEGVPVMVWNALSWPRSGLVEVPVPQGMRRVRVENPDGERVPSQRLGGGRLLFRAAEVPAMGYAVYRLVSGGAQAERPELIVSPRRMENRFLRVRLNRNGEVTSLYDKAAKREVLRGGRGNELQWFEDRPMNWEAWDVEYYTPDQALPLPAADSVRVVETGPVRAAVEVRRRFGESEWTQRILLSADEPELEFDTEVDWHESHKFLKVAFPVDVRSPDATYEIQFGCLRRPTHMNTSWDEAKYEVCAQRWADLSDATYGVTLLNDCKYGHDIHGNVMRLSLLRAAKSPDPLADMGRHRFRYAVLPHAGGHADAAATRRGYEFNVPLRGRVLQASDGDRLPVRSFFQVDAPGIVLDTVKKAEADGALVLRLYEAHGGQTRARLTTTLPVASAVETDLLERDTIGRARPMRDGSLDLTFGAFEVKTLKLSL
jgi:alpha-mannosidase